MTKIIGRDAELLIRKRESKGNSTELNAVWTSSSSMGENKGYIFQPLVQGEELWNSIYNVQNSVRNLPYDQREAIALAVCYAIKEIHDNDVIHNDIKVQNIKLLHERMVDEDVITAPQTYIATLIDFAFAKHLKIEGDGTTVMGGSVLGTPGNIAPEIISWRKYSKASDIYALSVVFGSWV